MEHANELDMTSGPLLKKIIVFTIPILLTGVLQLPVIIRKIMR